MKLKSVRICNFRSIKDQTVEFPYNCMILVGENEAGKSNALKAIAGGLSQKSYLISSKDKRKVLVNEAPPREDDYFIQYNYVFQVEEIYKILSKLVKGPLESIINIQGKILSLRQYCEEYFTQIIYVFDILTLQGKVCLEEEENLGVPFVLTRPLYVFLDAIKRKGVWYKQNDITDDASFTLVKNLVKEISSVDLVQIIREEIAQYFLENKTGVVFWKYSEALIVPDSISISTFRSSPDVSIPLRNIFELAKLPNIDQAFSEAEETDGDYENLLARVSAIATEKFTKKWPHLKKIKFLISSDGDLLRIKMQEMARYNFSERSEGFKRFISILLMLSVQVDTGKFSNKLLVIDEPDNSLCPSGSRYLRDELLKMSENNLVLYTTHSPFMIDRERLDRHMIVTKTKDITCIKGSKDSMYLQNEVLLNAIGTSIFEVLTANNLFFEEWSDHCIFRVAISDENLKHIDLYEKFIAIGIAYVHGVTSFKYVTPIVQLAQKNIFIFSDSAKSAITARNSYKREKGYQFENWFTIADLGGGVGLTVEDYLYDSFLQMGIDEVLGQGKMNIHDKGGIPLMQFLQDLSKEQKDQLKVYYATNVKICNIKPSYYLLIHNLWDKISSVRNPQVR